MLHVPAQVLREVMQRAASRADGGGLIFQPEAVERRDLEMFLHREERGFGRERPIVIAAQNLKRAAQQIAQRNRLGWENNFRWPQSLKFGEQRGIIFQFGRQKIARRQIYECKAEDFS